MKRSEINTILDETSAFLAEHKITLPAFASWNTDDFARTANDCDELFDTMLGWYVTDYGSDDFQARGLVAFTLRNGSQQDPQRYPKPYCEKILVLRDGQELPFHFHRGKMEDVINRGGGNIQIEVFNSTPDEGVDRDSDVILTRDGRGVVLSAGSTVTLHPGESVTFVQGIWHRWTVEPGTGTALGWEVSSVNDDNTDNCFLEAIPSVPVITEDEAIRYVLFSDYPVIKELASSRL